MQYVRMMCVLFPLMGFVIVDYVMVMIVYELNSTTNILKSDRISLNIIEHIRMDCKDFYKPSSEI